MIVRTTNTNFNPLGGLFGSVVMVIMGIVFFVVSGFLSKQDANIRERCSYQLQAEVVGFERSDSKDSTASTPLFEYSYNDETYSSKTGSYSSTYKDKFRIGNSYSIYVNPQDPMEIYSEDIAKTDGTFMTILRWGGIAFAVFGVISFAFSLIKIAVIGGSVGILLSEFFKKR